MTLPDHRGTDTTTYGRYQLLAPLGKGGMAEVFKAKSFGVEGFEKTLVIKRILPKLAENQSFVDMFIHEAKLAVRLSHANIVQVFDLGRVDPPSGEPPSYFMAMEYVAGLDLATVLARSKAQNVPVPVGMAVYVAAEVAKGLDHAHRRRDDAGRPLHVVHRDISPQNILLSWEGEVKVTDFGIAKARANLDDRPDEGSKRMLKGKYAYMSPEQARAENMDARSDIYSLGVVLYEALAGTNPFRAPTSFETLRRVQSGEVPPLQLLRDDLPDELIELVAGALKTGADERTKTAGSFYESLLAYLYQSGARFGAADLADFLEELGEEPVELSTKDKLTSSVHESTPVEVPKSVSNVRVKEVTQGGSLPSLSLMRGEATAVVVQSHHADGLALANVGEVLRRYGGHVIVTDGDNEVAALFGVRNSDGRDAEMAIRAGRVLLRAAGDNPHPLRVGVHVGRLLVDNQGEPSRDEVFSVLLGTAQSLARLEDGKIAVSSSAARHVRKLYSLRPTAQNDAMPGVPHAQVVGDIRGLHEAYGRFVGRRQELRLFGKLLAKAGKRRLHVITLAGSEGIGKTRLLYEVNRRLDKGDFNVGFYLATCAPRGKDTALSGIVAMLRVLCGVQDGDVAERIMAVEPRLRALGLLDDEADAVMHYLGADVDSTPNQASLRAALARALAGLAQDRLHAFVWDNADCLDSASIEVLSGVLERLQSNRIAIILSGREGLSNPFDSPFPHHAIQLGDLTADDTLRLIKVRLGIESVPAELLSFSVTRAGGHPLFFEELLREMLDSKAIVVQDGKLDTMRLDSAMAVPRSLRAIMASRVERLSEMEQAVLRAAAVVGEPFDAEILAAVVGEAVGEMSQVLVQLESEEIAQLTGPDVYAFASPLFADVVLDRVPPEVRKELSARTAVALSAKRGPKNKEALRRIANAYLQAGQRQKASDYLSQAARESLSRLHYDQATKHAIQALELAEMSRLTLGELLDQVRVLAKAVDRSRVGRDLPGLTQRMVMHADSNGGTSERRQMRLFGARILGAASHFDAAGRYLEQILAESDVDPAVGNEARIELGRLCIRQGDFAKALQVLEAVGEEGFGEIHKGAATMLMAQTHGALGHRDVALGYLEKLGFGDDEEAASKVEKLKLRGLIHIFSRHYDDAAEAHTEAASVARSAGLGFEVAVNLHNLAEALLRLEQFPRAYAALLQSQEACEACGADRLHSQNRMYLGYLDALNGNSDGEALLRNGIRFAEKSQFTWDVINGRLLLGMLLEHREEWQQSFREYRACQALAESTRNLLIQEDCLAGMERCERKLMELAQSIPPPTSRSPMSQSD